MRHFCLQLQEIIASQEILPGRAKGSCYDDKRSIVSDLSYVGNKTPLSVLDWMYKDSTYETRLDRKYELYKEVLKHSHLNPMGRRKEMDFFKESEKWKDVSVCDEKFCPKMCGARTVNISRLVS